MTTAEIRRSRRRDDDDRSTGDWSRKLAWDDDDLSPRVFQQVRGSEKKARLARRPARRRAGGSVTPTCQSVPIAEMRW